MKNFDSRKILLMIVFLSFGFVACDRVSNTIEKPANLDVLRPAWKPLVTEHALTFDLEIDPSDGYLWFVEIGGIALQRLSWDDPQTQSIALKRTGTHDLRELHLKFW